MTTPKPTPKPTPRPKPPEHTPTYPPPPREGYAIVDQRAGSFKVGGGTSTKPQSQFHETLKGAEKALSRMKHNRPYRIYHYVLEQEPES